MPYMCHSSPKALHVWRSRALKPKLAEYRPSLRPRLDLFGKDDSFVDLTQITLDNQQRDCGKETIKDWLIVDT